MSLEKLTFAFSLPSMAVFECVCPSILILHRFYNLYEADDGDQGTHIAAIQAADKGLGGGWAGRWELRGGSNARKHAWRLAGTWHSQGWPKGWTQCTAHLQHVAL